MLEDKIYFDSSKLKNVLTFSTNSDLEKLYKLFVSQLDELDLNLQKADFKKDKEQIGEWAHRYKSSAHSIGAIRLADILEKVEDSILMKVDLDNALIGKSELIELVRITRTIIGKHIERKL